MLQTKIRVEANSGYLRLRFTVNGQRYCHSLGLKDTEYNRAKAIIKKADLERRITQDLVDGCFDPTLERYKSQPTRTGLKTYELLNQFIEYKRNFLYEASLVKYHASASLLKEFFKERTVSSIDEAQALKFRSWYSQRVGEITLRERINLLSSCWEWAESQRLISGNPWKSAAQIPVRIQRKQPQPFSEEEIRLIIQGFRRNRFYSFYGDLVEFLMGTGCRPGEAFALEWGDVSQDCNQVWIGKSYSSGIVKEVKNGMAGYIRLSPNLRQLLKRRKPVDADPKALVFPAAKGGHMNTRDFRNRAWKRVLEEVGVEYRKPYSTRASLISYWLSQGESPLTVARYTRTSPEMIYAHYSAALPSDVRLPEIPGLEGYIDEDDEDDED